jgi:DNA-binding NarL/FixJ family response regulator
MMDAMSVLMVDANPTFLRIATRIIREYHSDDFTVVGMSSGGDDAICQATTLKPHVILLGVETLSTSTDVSRCVSHLRAACAGAAVIIIGPLDMPTYHQAARDAGADGFVSRTALHDARSLLSLIRRAPQAPAYSEERESLGARLSALTLACM